MRSRTEARAAKWFESFGWEWLYEPESLFSDAGIQYTPDFYLPTIDTVIEVKPVLFIHELTAGKRSLIELIKKPFALVSPAHANTFVVADFYGRLEGCDPWNNGDPDPWGWHSHAPECDQRTVFIDDNGGRYPRTHIYMGAGCWLRHQFGRECPCTN